MVTILMKGHVSLRAAHNALGIRPSRREELVSQDQLIKIAQLLFDTSTSDRVATCYAFDKKPRLS
ncbi:hypothetical protein E1B28_013716 [Marasmius oreades]|uniref:Uncharacterized protein n=1 Tax=Marasmius oreades TaxID=181124 RepID=A0A9P7RQC2_9AGAR|nr:uncharacterized protein E1B28_013716 [Marasmius oreades]KAG7087774.1 hypothetical protein E1B28_013716 [Marasmius oreades]